MIVQVQFCRIKPEFVREAKDHEEAGTQQAEQEGSGKPSKAEIDTNGTQIQIPEVEVITLAEDEETNPKDQQGTIGALSEMNKQGYFNSVYPVLVSFRDDLAAILDEFSEGG